MMVNGSNGPGHFARPDRAPESHLVGSISEFGKNRTVRPNIANTGTACSTATILKTHGFESDVSKNAHASSRAATATIGAEATGFSRLSLKLHVCEQPKLASVRFLPNSEATDGQRQHKSAPFRRRQVIHGVDHSISWAMVGCLGG